MTAGRHWRALAAFVIVLAGTACGNQSKSNVVAVVNGEDITEEQVQKDAKPELERLEQKRAELLAGLEREKKEAVQDALNEIVNDKVLAAEAKKQNVTVDELVGRELQARATLPSEDVVRSFYESNQARIKGSFEDTAGEIRNFLMEEERTRVIASLLVRLRRDYGFKSLIEPDRIKVATEGHPSKGPANAPVTIVEFSDFECPYCAGLFPTLQQIEQKYQDKLRIVYRQFPLNNIHSRAQKAAEASLCANDQNKFWQFHDALFIEPDKLSVDDLKAKASSLSVNAQAFSACLDSGKYATAVRDSIVEGSKAGVDGTPALFINGRILTGNQPYGAIEKIIEDELLRAGK